MAKDANQKPLKAERYSQQGLCLCFSNYKLEIRNIRNYKLEIEHLVHCVHIVH